MKMVVVRFSLVDMMVYLQYLLHPDDDTWLVCDEGPWICRECPATNGYRKNLTFSDVYKFIWWFSFLSTPFLFYISVPRDIDYRVEPEASDLLAQRPLLYRWLVTLYGRSQIKSLFVLLHVDIPRTRKYPVNRTTSHSFRSLHHYKTQLHF